LKGGNIVAVQQVPENICDILRSLEGEKVVIVFESGEKELVKVVRLVGDILVAKLLERKFIFVDCDCICAVIADCFDVLAEKFDLQYE